MFDFCLTFIWFFWCNFHSFFMLSNLYENFFDGESFNDGIGIYRQRRFFNAIGQICYLVYADAFMSVSWTCFFFYVFCRMKIKKICLIDEFMLIYLIKFNWFQASLLWESGMLSWSSISFLLFLIKEYEPTNAIRSALACDDCTFCLSANKSQHFCLIIIVRSKKCVVKHGFRFFVECKFDKIITTKKCIESS